MRKFTSAVITALSLVSISAQADELYNQYQQEMQAQNQERQPAPPQSNIEQIRSQNQAKEEDFAKRGFVQTGTAAEQGYVDEDEERKTASEEAARLRNDTARQRGEIEHVVVGVGAVGEKSKMVKEWLPALISKGVSRDKVMFEAKRLTPAEFNQWAHHLYQIL